MSSKIVALPFGDEEEVYRSRNVTRLNKWAHNSRFVSAIMVILEWFTIPFEVIFRRDMGQRWFTPVNYFAGLLLILFFETLQWALDKFWPKIQYFLSHVAGILHPFQQPNDADSSKGDPEGLIASIAIIYLMMGLYHLFKNKWRNQANVPVHSFDDGTSRLRWPARIIMEILNAASVPHLFIAWLLIPPKQRKGKPKPKLITNWMGFTNTVIEPTVVIIFAALTTEVASLWLYITGFAMFVHANWKEMARKNKILDLQDAKIEAETMREIRTEMIETKAVSEQKDRKSQHKPRPALPSEPFTRYPELSTIIGQLHIDLKYGVNNKKQ